QYLSPGTQGQFDLYSFGADGKPGGSDLNADIGNWDL
ncbi:type II secretion system protein GspG, partial [Stutzerimonas stutzeri]